MARHRLVLTDHAQRQAEARAADQPSRRQHQGDQRQELPVDRVLRHVDEDIAPDRAVDVDLVPGHDLADQLRQPEGEDHEIHAGEPQRREADHERDRDTNRARDA
jgi:hypothetical protein